MHSQPPMSILGSSLLTFIASHADRPTMVSIEGAIRDAASGQWDLAYAADTPEHFRAAYRDTWRELRGLADYAEHMTPRDETKEI